MTRQLCILSAAALSACASQTKIAQPVREAIAARHTGRLVELRRSCYYGNLYDENEKWLLSEHAFADTYHIVDTDGAPIHPTGQRGIVPAGTKLVVSHIEFPDVRAMARRMLTTPRYNPWIYLQPAPSSTSLPRERPWFILLLPMDMETEKEVEDAIAALLAPEGEVSAWLASLRPTVRAAIEHKDVVEGMTEQELVAAMGAPLKWIADARDGERARVAWYHTKEAWFVGDTVVEVRDGRSEESIAPAKPPDAKPGVEKAEKASPDATQRAD